MPIRAAVQYGLIQGYAYYLVYGLSMMAAGLMTDKYRLNRVYVVAIGSGLTGAALVIEVRSFCPTCQPHGSAALGQRPPCQRAHGSPAVSH